MSLGTFEIYFTIIIIILFIYILSAIIVLNYSTELIAIQNRERIYFQLSIYAWRQRIKCISVKTNTGLENSEIKLPDVEGRTYFFELRQSL